MRGMPVVRTRLEGSRGCDTYGRTGFMGYIHEVDLYAGLRTLGATAKAVSTL